MDEALAARLLILEVAIKHVLAGWPETCAKLLDTLETLDVDPVVPGSAHAEGAAIAMRDWIIWRHPQLGVGRRE